MSTTTSEQLETTILLVTPENFGVTHRVAGPFLRLAAYLIDFAIRILILYVLQIVVSIFDGIGLEGYGIGFYLFGYFLVDWFYGGFFEGFFNGQTPGKRACRLRVVTIDGGPISPLQAFLRNILRFIDSMPIYIWFIAPDKQIPLLLYQVGLWAAMSNPRFQRLGDIVCGTMVIFEERHWLRPAMPKPDPLTIEVASSIPPNFEVSKSLARVLAYYVERRHKFSPMRLYEMAEPLATQLRVELELPESVGADRLLCALYYRAFISDSQEQTQRGSLVIQT